MMKNSCGSRLMIILALAVFGINLSTFGEGLIDLTDSKGLSVRRPILIAHRGGVVGKGMPECSIAAIREAARRGYAMVELDVRRSIDGVPIIFHDRTLDVACGRSGSISDFAASALVEFEYANSDEKIVNLNSALGFCVEMQLGVMLDLKAGTSDAGFLGKINQLIKDHQLQNAAVSFSGGKLAREILTEVMFTADSQELKLLQAGGKVDLRGTFWFGLPASLSDSYLQQLKANGALVFPAINTFRYPSKDHLRLAEIDIQRLMKGGVDGFQIDSVYDRFFPVR